MATVVSPARDRFHLSGLAEHVRVEPMSDVRAGASEGDRWAAAMLLSNALMPPDPDIGAFHENLPVGGGGAAGC